MVVHQVQSLLVDYYLASSLMTMQKQQHKLNYNGSGWSDVAGGKSRQVIGLQALIMGDFVCSVLSGSFGEIIAFADEVINMIVASVDRNGEMLREHLFRWGCMGLWVVICSLRDQCLKCAITQIGLSHPQPHHTLPNTGQQDNIGTLRSVVFLCEDIYIVSYTIFMHIIGWKSLA